ncbi:CRISPR-associated protein Cas1, partial [mine drainage metagenome]
GVRLYASSNPKSNSGALLRQAGVYLDGHKRLAAAREIWSIMFGERPAQNLGIDQLRGAEGARVRALLPGIAKSCGIEWVVRDGSSRDPVNQAINSATSTLYG